MISAIILAIPLLALAVAVGGFAIWARGVSVDESLLPTMSAAPTFYDASGNIIEGTDDSYLSEEELKTLENGLGEAFVAVEDKRFFSHKGYDVYRIFGAMGSNLKAGKIKEGASTITQQLVKNTHLSQERTLKRKLTELAIAAKLEKEYSKDEILSMYLSVIYFGSGAYGVKSAARTYFDKDISKLSLAECAALAGTVKNPSRYSPKNETACNERKAHVLSLMLEQGYIDETEYLNALNEAVKMAPQKNKAKKNDLYVKLATEELLKKLNMTKYQFDNSGLKVYTFLDNGINIERSEGANSVGIVLDKDAHVLAYSSDLSYGVKRQPGSVLKPLAVYAPAFDMGIMSPSTPVVDEEVDFFGYSPQNYNGQYLGDTTVNEAIKKSLNSVSLKTLGYIGIDPAANYLDAFGISLDEEDKNYALALGVVSRGVDPLLLATAYSSISRKGVYKEAQFVNYAVKNGQKIYSAERTEYHSGESYPASESGRRVISSGAASLLTYSLSQTAKSGTARTLGRLPFEVAAKTGTAERADGLNSDAWCVSYNDSATVLVWRGSDDGMTEKGGGMAANCCFKIWQELSERINMADEISLSGVEECLVDEYSTMKSMRVVAATPFTPDKFVKKELFMLGNTPSAEGTRFVNAEPARFDVFVENGLVKLNFEAEGIFTYDVVRTDVLGEKCIAKIDGSDGEMIISDRPTSFGGRVKYTLIKRLDGFEPVCSDKEIYYSTVF